MNNLYKSSAASLFASIARDDTTKSEVPKELTVHFDVTCPWCLSDDTKPLNAVLGIFECAQCGEVFGRSSAK